MLCKKQPRRLGILPGMQLSRELKILLSKEQGRSCLKNKIYCYAKEFVAKGVIELLKDKRIGSQRSNRIVER